jgi:hypothetical protein
MRFPLSFRVASACTLATLILSLGLAPSFAHGGAGGPVARPGLGLGHSQHFAARGFNERFDAGRSGPNRFGPNRFDRFGFNRSNRSGANQLLVGGGWGWDGYSASAAPAPFLAGDAAPVIINIGIEPDPGDHGALGGGCVIHKLSYDIAGKYVGERQIPHC